MIARKGVELKIQTVATSFLISQESSVFEQDILQKKNILKV